MACSRQHRLIPAQAVYVRAVYFNGTPMNDVKEGIVLDKRVAGRRYLSKERPRTGPPFVLFLLVAEQEEVCQRNPMADRESHSNDSFFSHFSVFSHSLQRRSTTSSRTLYSGVCKVSPAYPRFLSPDHYVNYTN